LWERALAQHLLLTLSTDIFKFVALVPYDPSPFGLAQRRLLDAGLLALGNVAPHRPAIFTQYSLAPLPARVFEVLKRAETLLRLILFNVRVSMELA
jgi:hypothetical protein